MAASLSVTVWLEQLRADNPALCCSVYPFEHKLRVVGKSRRREAAP